MRTLKIDTVTFDDGLDALQFAQMASFYQRDKPFFIRMKKALDGNKHVVTCDDLQYDTWPDLGIYENGIYFKYPSDHKRYKNRQ